jgi:ABC-type polysaccharide/polyol phosphate transport system ATPase subunit
MADDSMAVSAKGLSKKYRLYGSPKERLLEALDPFRKKYHKEFWALQGVSFDVPKGLTLGIMGRNGSGKSTLLQIVSSVLRPTTGSVEVRGRVSALLELGAGFSPEFTGRENVLMQGRTFGYSASEMRSRLPVIQQFAEIGEFFDQPLKTYSSGMYARLAFAAAIYVDPDILIVDEALAVGDAKFQHKCYRKFLEFQSGGKTILFVSHDTNAIVEHCNRAMLLDHGRVLEQGEPKHVANCYHELLFTGVIEGYTPYPELVFEGYKGFNIVKFGRRLFAVDQELGPMDFANSPETIIEQRVEEKRIFVGNSEKAVREAVDAARPDSPQSGGASAAERPPGDAMKSQGEPLRARQIEEFLRDTPAGDHCPARNSYNRNEYRFGDRRGEIVDFLVSDRASCAPAAMDSGDFVDIYVKARVHQPIPNPMFGFAMRALDGLMVGGSNTRYLQMELAPAFGGEILLGKFTIRLNVHYGDYFIDLGLAQKEPAEDIPIDIRTSVIHLAVRQTQRFDGIAALDSSFTLVSRRAG